MTVTWMEPPEKKSSVKDQVIASVGALRTKPGHWAIIYIGGAGAVTARAKLLKERGCEVRVTNGESGRELYARFTG